MQQSASEIIVGARDSPLSKAQVEEVYLLLTANFPEVKFQPLYVKTYGDIDQKTSLRTLAKTDFFTREIDALLLQRTCRIAIHSAKDLPDPMPQGLTIAAMTKGIDSRDALVLREKETILKLPPFAKIATSSNRREEAVLNIRKDLAFVDIRGTIEKRLEKLQQREVDGVVVAMAALIRLNLVACNFLILSGDTVPFQGRLAIVVREDDLEMKNLFQCLHHL